MVVAGLLIALFVLFLAGLVALIAIAAGMGLATLLPFVLGGLVAVAAMLVLEGSALLGYFLYQRKRGECPSTAYKWAGIRLIAVGFPCFFVLFGITLWSFLTGAVLG